eukprot:gene1442-4602_t
MELQKMAGFLLIRWDIDMYDPIHDEPALARTSDLMEDVGQISYVFADKTGTLTENEMVFKYCNIGTTCLSVFGYYEGLRISEGPSDSETFNTKAAAERSHPSNRNVSNKCVSSKEELQYCHEVKTFLKQPEAKAFFECLAICHTVTVEYEGELSSHNEVHRKRKLAAASPDEEALVLATEIPEVGYHLDYRNEKLITLDYGGEKLTYEIIHVLPFDSKRKRMSILVRDPRGQVRLFMKGADSSVLPRTTATNTNDTSQPELKCYNGCQHFLDLYSRFGLRTLVVAERDLSVEEASVLIPELIEAHESMENRKVILNDIYERIEQNMTLLGVTAVEDRLQEGVPETITKIRQAQMALWVLTGDKVQTAINISISAGHFKSNTPQLRALSISNPQECNKRLMEFYQQNVKVKDQMSSNHDDRKGSYGTLPLSAHSANKKKTSTAVDTAGVALIIDDVTLATALKHTSKLFRAVSMRCGAVLCCRLSPAQKAAVVRLVKTGSVLMDDEMSVGLKINLNLSLSNNPLKKSGNPLPSSTSSSTAYLCNDAKTDAPHTNFESPTIKHIVTLAIGDGANDVAMIREAHIGVGIMGKEGRQAARTSDYSIGRFRFLARLLLVHGHFSYWRMAYTVQYFFYKNLIYILPFIYFGPESLFSAQTLYEQWLLTFWSLLFTSLPILCFGIFEKDLDDKILMKYPRTYSIFAGNSFLTWTQFIMWNVKAIWHGTVSYFGMVLLLNSMRPVRVTCNTGHGSGLDVALKASPVVYSLESILNPFTSPGVFWSGYDLWGTYYFWIVLVLLVIVAMLPGYMYGCANRFFWPNYVERLQAFLWRDAKWGPIANDASLPISRQNQTYKLKKCFQGTLYAVEQIFLGMLTENMNTV